MKGINRNINQSSLSPLKMYTKSVCCI